MKKSHVTKSTPPNILLKGAIDKTGSPKFSQAMLSSLSSHMADPSLKPERQELN